MCQSYSVHLSHPPITNTCQSSWHGLGTQQVILKHVKPISKTPIEEKICYISDNLSYLTKSKQGHGICLRGSDIKTEMQMIRGSYIIKAGGWGVDLLRGNSATRPAGKKKKKKH